MEQSRFQLLGVGLALKHGFGAFQDGPRDKSANALPLQFGGSGYHFVSGVVQISSYRVRESLSRSTTFAPVALLSHEKILLASD